MSTRMAGSAWSMHTSESCLFKGTTNVQRKTHFSKAQGSLSERQSKSVAHALRNKSAAHALRNKSAAHALQNKSAAHPFQNKSVAHALQLHLPLEDVHKQDTGGNEGAERFHTPSKIKVQHTPSSSTYHWKMYTNRIPVAMKALNDFTRPPKQKCSTCPPAPLTTGRCTQTGYR